MKNSISSFIYLLKLNNKKEWESYDFEINNNSIYFSDCDNNNNNENFYYYSLENIDIIDEKQSSNKFKIIIFNPHQIFFFKTFNLFDKNNILNLFSKFTGKKYSITEANSEKNNNNENQNFHTIENNNNNNNLFSFDNNFILKEYLNLPNRNFLPLQLNFPQNYTQEIIKSVSSKQFPIIFMEPITTLQKQCESFKNINILNECFSEQKTENKLLYILNYIFTNLYENSTRILKPFNPILGETFEYFDKNLNFRYFSEQVQHKPKDISAYFCETKNLLIFGDTKFESSFKMLKGAFEIELLTKIHLLFKNEIEFIYNQPKFLLKGIFLGKISANYYGEIYIYNNKDDVVCKIDFNENDFSVEGSVFKANDENNPIYNIKGKWNKSVSYSNGEDEEIFWEINENNLFGKNNENSNYSLSNFTQNLNAINDELKNSLPITDTRLRGDLRLYEENKIEEAEKMKKKLEQFQRNRHSDFNNNNFQYEPVYFKKCQNSLSNDEIYQYKGGYFESREKKNFKGEFDIFMIRENKNIEIVVNNNK